MDSRAMVDPTSPDSRAESTVQQSVFEGLFVHVLEARPGTPLAEALRRAGYDVSRQEATYPRHVWIASLEAACRVAYPQLSQEQAMRELGKSLIGGFFKTFAGRAVSLLAPMLGPEGVLKRMPRFFTMGSPGTQMTVHEEGPKAWRAEVRDRYVVPDFSAGVLETALEKAGVVGQVSVMDRAAGRCTLHVTW